MMINNEKLPLSSDMSASALPDRLSMDRVLSEFHAFNRGFNSVILATVNADGFADATYAPTMQRDGKFYLYISQLASHTQNLWHQSSASLLLIEPENEANLFRRQRSIIRCTASVIERDSEQWCVLLDCYEQHLGKMMRTLRELKDFHLFELTPIQATYVRGFAQAYQITAEQLSLANSFDK